MTKRHRCRSYIASSTLAPIPPPSAAHLSGSGLTKYLPILWGDTGTKSTFNIRETTRVSENISTQPGLAEYAHELRWTVMLSLFQCDGGAWEDEDSEDLEDQIERVRAEHHDSSLNTNDVGNYGTLSASFRCSMRSHCARIALAHIF